MKPKTNNIISLFEYMVKDRRAPELFLPWPMISCVGACLGNRVKVVTPGIPRGMNCNLYLTLIGDSSSGKSWVTNEMKHMLECTAYEEKINYMAARITFEKLIEQGENNKKHPNRSQIYLVQDEVGSDVGASKELAENYIKGLTKIYNGEKYDQGTKGGGMVHLAEGHSVSVLWCTTLAWFQSAMTRELAIGGFIPRMCCVWHKETFVQPFDNEAAPPDDWAQCEGIIVQRLSEILDAEGVIEFAPDAYEAYREWFYNKPATPAGDEGIRWDMWVPKIAAIHRMAEDDSMEIQVCDVEAAAEWVTEAANPPMQYLGKPDINAGGLEFIVQYVEKQETGKAGVDKNKISHAASNRGIDGTECTRLLRTLVQNGRLVCTPVTTVGRPKEVYSTPKE